MFKLLFLVMSPFFICGSEFSRQDLLDQAARIRGFVPALQQIQSQIIERQKSQELIEADIQGIKDSIAALPNPETLVIDSSTPLIYEFSQISARSKILIADIASLERKIALLTSSLEVDRQDFFNRYESMIHLSPDEIERFFSHNSMSDSVGSLESKRCELESNTYKLEQTKESLQQSLYQDQPLYIEQLLQAKKATLQAQKDALLLQWHQALKNKADMQREIIDLQASQQANETKYKDVRESHRAAVEIYANKQSQSHSKWARMSFALMNKQDLERKKYIDGLKLDREKLLEGQGREELERLNMHKEDQKMRALIVSEQAEQKLAKEAHNKSKKAKQRRELQKKLEEQEQEEQKRLEMQAKAESQFLEDQMQYVKEERQPEKDLATLMDSIFEAVSTTVKVDQTIETLPLYQKRYQDFLSEKAQYLEKRAQYIKEISRYKSEEKQQELLYKFDCSFKYQSMFEALFNYQKYLDAAFFDDCLPGEHDFKKTYQFLLEFDKSFENLKKIVEKIRLNNEEPCWYIQLNQYNMLKDYYDELGSFFKEKSGEKFKAKLQEQLEQLILLQKKRDKAQSLKKLFEDTFEVKKDSKSKDGIKSCIDNITSINDKIKEMGSTVPVLNRSFERFKRYEASKYLFDVGNILNPAYLVKPVSVLTYQNLPLQMEVQEEYKAILDQLKTMTLCSVVVAQQSKASDSIQHTHQLSKKLDEYNKMILHHVENILKIQGFSENDCQILPSYLLNKAAGMKDRYRVHGINKDTLSFDIFGLLQKDISEKSLPSYSLEHVDNLVTIIVMLTEATAFYIE